MVVPDNQHTIIGVFSNLKTDSVKIVFGLLFVHWSMKKYKINCPGNKFPYWVACR